MQLGNPEWRAHRATSTPLRMQSCTRTLEQVGHSKMWIVRDAISTQCGINVALSAKGTEATTSLRPRDIYMEIPGVTSTGDSKPPPLVRSPRRTSWSTTRGRPPRRPCPPPTTWDGFCSARRICNRREYSYLSGSSVSTDHPT